jgi:glyoxylase-like metal-dependent hydrolase (beta-lactamase superfamily II)
MKKALIGALVFSSVLFAQDATATLDAAAKAMGIGNLTSIEYAGDGSMYNFGQAVNANAPWPTFSLRTYQADINYATPAMRVEIYRTLPDGNAPFGGFTQMQFVSGNDAWNVAGNPPAPVAAPANVTERQLQIWLTPPGFIKAAMANHATVHGKQVTFTTADHHKIVGTLDARNMLAKTQTWIDNPVLGDMLVETTYSDYKDHGGVWFPSRIIQSQGGHPVLDLTVSEIAANRSIPIAVPEKIKGAVVPPANVISQKIGNGVWYLTGGTHHSLVAEFKDHLVLIEAPLDQARTGAVLAEAHELVPNKPVTIVVNSHNHFDHLGGIRTAAAEAGTIIAPASNTAYYERILNAPHTLNPDKLSTAGKKAKVEGVTGKRVLSDGMQEIDLYVEPLKGHNDAMMLIYFPKDRILSEADAYTPGAPNAPPPDTPNPLSVQLYNEILQLKLDVNQIAPLHGRLTSMDELKKMIGKSSS